MEGMKMYPRVSIITQAYNEEEYLERCIQSVLNQSYQNFELVLIDNGSEDATGAIMRAYAEKDGRIRVIRNEVNQCYSFWIKNAKELIRGDYFVSLDADDWLEPSFLDECVQTALADDAQIVCTLSVFHYPDGDMYPKQFDKHEVLTSDDVGGHFRTFCCIEAIWGKLISAETVYNSDFDLVNKAIETRSDYGLDAALFWACVENSKKISFLPEYIYHYNADHDITLRGYHKRLPYSVRSFPVNLEQEYDLLKKLGGIQEEPLKTIFEEYLLKMGSCLESCLLDDFSETERIKRIARAYAADFNSARPEILRQHDALYAHSYENLRAILQTGDADPSELQWIEQIIADPQAFEAIVLSLMIIRYLSECKEQLLKERDGLIEAVSLLEKDRAGKDCALAERENTIAELIRIRDEKDRAIAKLFWNKLRKRKAEKI